jgi:hypothetical protein
MEINHFRVISSLGLPVPDLVELEEDAGPDVLVATGNEESVRVVRAVAQVLQVEQALPGLNNKKEQELTTERSNGSVVFVLHIFKGWQIYVEALLNYYGLTELSSLPLNRFSLTLS